MDGPGRPADGRRSRSYAVTIDRPPAELAPDGRLLEPVATPGQVGETAEVPR